MLLLLALLLLLRLPLAQAADAPPTDLDIFAQRAALSILPPPNTLAAFDAAVSLNLTYLAPDFSFTDINYSFCLNADWPAMMHAERAMLFTAAYASPGSAHYRSAPLLASVHGLLAFWFAFNAKHKSTNWWMNQVGVPGFVGRNALLLQQLGQLLPSEQAGALASTATADTYRGCEPTNCLWLAGNVLLGGLLQRNDTLVRRCTTDILSTIDLRNPFSPNDPSGIKVDGSFMMHGSLLYSGGYGMCYALGLINLLAWTRGTAYALPEGDARWQLLSHYLLDGTLRMMHYGDPLPPYGPAAWDPSALGRNCAWRRRRGAAQRPQAPHRPPPPPPPPHTPRTPPHLARTDARPYGHDPGSAAGQAVTFPVDAVAGVGGPRAAEFAAFAALLNGTARDAGVPPSALAFSRHFYAADYTMHSAPLPLPSPLPSPPPPQLPSWTASVFAASSRTRRSEITNAEGVQSWHMAENALWVMLNGTEYLDAWPAMSMGLVPGTTVLAPPHVYSDGDIGGVGATAFVGGVSLAASSFTANDFVAPNRAGLAYRKATALFPAAAVALSAGITANSSSAGVVSVLAQRRAGGGACVGQGSPAPPPAPMAGIATSAGASVGPGRALPTGTNATLEDGEWWVWEGSMGYLLLDRLPAALGGGRSSSAGGSGGGGGGGAAAPPLPTLRVSSLVQNGTWSKLGVWPDWTACNIFTLSAAHAPPVLNASLAFAIAPGVALSVWEGGAGTPGSAAALARALTLVNTRELQAVHHAGEALLGAAAYAASGAPAPVAPGLSAGFSAPGAFLVALGGGGGGGGGVALGAAQPAQVPWAATVELRGAALPPARAGAANCSSVPGGLDIALTSPPSDGSTVVVQC